MHGDTTTSTTIEHPLLQTDFTKVYGKAQVLGLRK